MDTLDGIEKLAKKAQTQETPAFDVSDRVLAQISLEKSNTFVVFDFFAGAFATAASAIFYIGINAWTNIMNPLAQFFAPLQEVRLW